MKFYVIKLLFLITIVLYMETDLLSQGLKEVIVRSDNDISTLPDDASPRSAPPAEFIAKFNELQKLLSSRTKSEPVRLDKHLQTFRITSPDSNYIFVSEFDEGIIGMQLYLFYCDVESRSCSEPENVNAYFMRNNEQGFEWKNGQMIDKPIISFADVDNDGRTELLIKRRAHNGTWNAVETIVFRMDSSKISKWFQFNSKELVDVNAETMTYKNLKSVNNYKATLSVTIHDLTFHIDIPGDDEIIDLGK